MATRIASSLTLALLCLTLAACEPTIPPAPREGYALVPRSFSARLDGPPGSPAEGRSLLGVLGESGALGSRDITIEVSGDLPMDRQISLTAEIRARVPQAVVTFQPGVAGAPRVTVRSLDVLPRRCLVDDGWAQDSLMIPGCASDLTFARMVEDPYDLVTGKPAGPAPLAPLARDALRYMDQDGQPGSQQAGGHSGSSAGPSPSASPTSASSSP